MKLPKKALIVGIDHYDNFRDLDCCVNDAIKMAEILSRHYDGAPNYDSIVLRSGEAKPVTEAVLRSACEELFGDKDFHGEVLFYFSGHGAVRGVEEFLVTQDGQEHDPGLSLASLLAMATASQASSAVLIVDTCFSGGGGNLPALGDLAVIREGITILAACGKSQLAKGGEENSIFTLLLGDALRGGAADVQGVVSIAAAYAHVEQLLGPRDQRPVYKSNASSLPPLRRCEPKVDDSLLRGLSDFFSTDDAEYRMDASFEATNPERNDENVDIFQKFKSLRNAGLLETENGTDLFWTAINGGAVRLTPKGRYYRRLSHRI